MTSNIDEKALMAAVQGQVVQNLRNQLEAKLDWDWIEEPIWRSMNSMKHHEKEIEAQQLLLAGDGLYLLHQLPKGGPEFGTVCDLVLRRLAVCYGVRSVKDLFLRGTVDNGEMLQGAMFDKAPAVPLPKVLMNNLLLKATDPDGFQDILVTEKLNECCKTLHLLKDKKPKKWDIDFLLNFAFGTTVFIAAVLALACVTLPVDADPEKGRALIITSNLFYLIAAFAIFGIAAARAQEHQEKKREHGIHESFLQALEYEFWPHKEVKDGFGDHEHAPLPVRSRLVERITPQASPTFDNNASAYKRTANPYRKSHFM